LKPRQICRGFLFILAWMKLPRKDIPTERLILKPYEIKYYNEAFQLIHKNKPRLVHSFPNLLRATETLENTKDFVQNKIFDWNKDRAYGFMIMDKNTNQLIGHINIKDIDWKKNQTELSYFIDVDMERKGLMTEAIQKIIRLCFIVIQFERIFVRIVTTNIASQKTIEKAGLKYEGAFYQDYITYDNQIVDTYCYGISKEAFERY
jgi:RimJ/RimL family protein N-acetyltransferase